MGRGESDVIEKKESLTKRQREFMEALQKAIAESSVPVSVDQIRFHFKKSDSRVRSNIKLLMRKGYIRCVGKTKMKKYVPSMLWLEEIDGDEAFDESDLPCVGGYCATPGCGKMAEDFWRDDYYCRDCVIGHDAVSDTKDIREQFLLRIGPQSSAGQLLEQVWPTMGEDMLPEEVCPKEPEKKSPRAKKRSRRKKSSKTSKSRGSSRSEKESAEP